MAADRDELAPYFVKDLPKFDKSQSKGSGSYGSAYLVTVNGFPCIAKRLHDILVGQSVSDKERASITRRFREECILLSRLRHPNIVQFIGVHSGETSGELTLLMEGMYTDLEKCLEKCLAACSNIPLPIQLSILLDVAYGLLYLHSQKQPIIHRDVKASNVLLTRDMKAKLADLGVSKILDFHPLSEIARTVCPGTPGVMPPEALVERPSYSTKLDNFSFGTLVLHVVNHEFPLPFETDKFQKGKQHIARRSSAIGKMGEGHCLHPLVTSCLRDDPKKRPTANEICNALEKLNKEYPRRFDDVLDMYKKIRDVETEKEALSVKLNEEEEKRSKIELSLLAKESDWGEIMAEQTAEMERLKRELKARTQEVQTYTKYLNSERQTRAKLEEICSELESKLVEMQGELELMEMDRDDHRERLAQVKELKHKMEGDLTSAMKEIMVAELAEHKQSLVQKLERAHDKLIKSEADADKMRKELKRAQDRLKKKGYAAEQRALEDELSRLKGENQDLCDTIDTMKHVNQLQVAIFRDIEDGNACALNPLAGALVGCTAQQLPTYVSGANPQQNSASSSIEQPSNSFHPNLAALPLPEPVEHNQKSDNRLGNTTPISRKVLKRAVHVTSQITIVKPPGQLQEGHGCFHASDADIHESTKVQSQAKQHPANQRQQPISKSIETKF